MKRVGLALLLSAAPAFGWTLLSPQIEGWATKTLVIHVNPANCTVSDEVLYSQIDSAIAIWNKVPTSGLTLVRSLTPSTVTPAEFDAGTDTESPVIFCDPDFETSIGSSSVVPAATSVRRIVAGPLTTAAIYLNAQAGAGAEISQLDSESFLIAFTHEMGHMLGLGHSQASTSLMYYSVGGKSTARLTEDDRMGIAYLYPRNEFKDGAFGCAAVHGSGTPWGLAAAIVFFFGLIGFSRAVRFGLLRALPE